MPSATYPNLRAATKAAGANRDARAGEHKGADDARAHQRGEHWREQDYTDAQVRHELLREGFTADQAARFLSGDLAPRPSSDTDASEAEAGASAARGSRPSSSGRGGGGIGVGSSAAGVLLAIVAYPAGIAFLTGGPTGLRKWFMAKFLNQTSTSRGVFDTARPVTDGLAAGGVAGTTPSAYVTQGGRAIIGASYVTGGAASVVTSHTRATGGRPTGGSWGAPGTNLVTVKLAGINVRVNRRCAPAFEGLVRDLVAAGYRPRVIGGYANRNIAGTSTKSNHAWGAAIDIDPLRNPRYGSARGGRHAIPDGLAIKLAAAHGLRWGGTYQNSKDYMHFEDANGPAS